MLQSMSPGGGECVFCPQTHLATYCPSVEITETAVSGTSLTLLMSNVYVVMQQAVTGEGIVCGIVPLLLVDDESSSLETLNRSKIGGDRDQLSSEWLVTLRVHARWTSLIFRCTATLGAIMILLQGKATTTKHQVNKHEA